MSESSDHVLDVGLTGGIASGKSTVASEFRALGATVIDADQLARDVVAPGTEGLADVVAAFGEQVLTADGSLDRPAVGAVVFDDAAARDTLNGIIHPRVRAEAARRRQAAIDAAAGERVVVVQDIPLLTETQQADRFDHVVVVQAPQVVRVARMVKHRGMTEEAALARIGAQATDAERAAIADVLILNDGDLDSLRTRVRQAWSELTGA
ncbi:dephospho-CoA kinase [Zhihengliuella flava]|uniref:Dephospho-CoA kinase n=1 Tax=Zhihengliuella flava TaxID=1285193 RepID=A0A931DFD1_9MICC|nr:dephospho-CoA kinase [Zhihengliuella flava]MBG6085748.1 dephospho-CoA kinase [Zhihengliuella flava]